MVYLGHGPSGHCFMHSNGSVFHSSNITFNEEYFPRCSTSKPTKPMAKANDHQKNISHGSNTSQAHKQLLLDDDVTTSSTSCTPKPPKSEEKESDRTPSMVIPKGAECKHSPTPDLKTPSPPSTPCPFSPEVTLRHRNTCACAEDPADCLMSCRVSCATWQDESRTKWDDVKEITPGNISLPTLPTPGLKPVEKFVLRRSGQETKVPVHYGNVYGASHHPVDIIKKDLKGKGKGQYNKLGSSQRCLPPKQSSSPRHI
jgi:hypothetical protein